MNPTSEAVSPTRALADLASLYPSEVRSLLELPVPEAVEVLALGLCAAVKALEDPAGSAAAVIREALGMTYGDTETALRALSPADSDRYEALCSEVSRKQP